jgi:hypothetical protein
VHGEAREEEEGGEGWAGDAGAHDEDSFGGRHGGLGEMDGGMEWLNVTYRFAVVNVILMGCLYRSIWRIYYDDMHSDMVFS